MRILDRDKLMLDMTQARASTPSAGEVRAAIAVPYGMILVTGPTGSGKTTTLYSADLAAQQVRDQHRDRRGPGRVQADGINQVQMQAKIGLTFAAALRSFLRQDPDVIMVGEIRDWRPPKSPSRPR